MIITVSGGLIELARAKEKQGSSREKLLHTERVVSDSPPLSPPVLPPPPPPPPRPGLVHPLTVRAVPWLSSYADQDTRQD